MTLRILLKGTRLSLVLSALALCCSVEMRGYGDQVALAWDPSPDTTTVAGYMIHYGTTNGVYNGSLIVGNALSALVPNLTEGLTYFFVVTAYTSTDLESDFSNQVSLFASPRITAIIKAGTQSRIFFNSTTNRRYTLQQNLSFSSPNWINVVSNIVGTGNSMQATNNSSGSTAFYRIVGSP